MSGLLTPLWLQRKGVAMNSTLRRSCVVSIIIAGIAVPYYYARLSESPRRRHTAPRTPVTSDAEEIRLESTAPQKEFTATPRTEFPQLRPKQFLSLNGAIPATPKDEPRLLTAEIVKVRQNNTEVIANTEALLVDDLPTGATEYRLLINAPPEPGRYLLRLKWGFSSYIGHGELIVK